MEKLPQLIQTYLCDPSKDHPCNDSANCAWLHEDGSCACTRYLAKSFFVPISYDEEHLAQGIAHIAAKKKRIRLTGVF